MVIRCENNIIEYNTSKNPDRDTSEFEALDFWWLELNGKGVPIREMGFDKYGHVKYVAPLHNDRGLWCDSAVCFEMSDWKDEEVSIDEFSAKWQVFTIGSNT